MNPDWEVLFKVNASLEENRDIQLTDTEMESWRPRLDILPNSFNPEDFPQVEQPDFSNFKVKYPLQPDDTI